MAFRKWRKQNYGVSEQRIASNQTGNLQVRELGAKGRGLLSTGINSLADDLNFEFWEHSGAGHRENRAFDIPVSDLKMGDRVSQFFKARGYDIIWRSAGHFNHVHVEAPANKAEEFFKIVGKKPKEKVNPTAKPKSKPQAKGNWWDNLNPFKPQSSTPKRSQPSSGKVPTSFKVENNGFTDTYTNLNGRYTQNGKPISKEIYDAVAKNQRNGMQGGGLIGSQNRRNYSSLSTYPSYDGSGGMMIAIQPIIVEKPIPVPTGGNKTIMFPVPVSVNNSNMASLNRG
jgi:hypothetical protein